MGVAGGLGSDGIGEWSVYKSLLQHGHLRFSDFLQSNLGLSKCFKTSRSCPFWGQGLETGIITPAILSYSKESESLPESREGDTDATI